MAIYRVTVEKQMTDGPYALQKWSNVYHIDRADYAAAALAAPVLADNEQGLYPDNIKIIRWSVADPTLPRTGFSQGVSITGNRSTGAVATQLPLFNTVVARLLVPSGRPSMMHLRVGLDESEIDTGNIITTLYDAIGTNWGAPLVALGYVCDESGQHITDYLVDLKVQGRQLGWHRRTRPGFKRGWVPV